MRLPRLRQGFRRSFIVTTLAMSALYVLAHPRLHAQLDWEVSNLVESLQGNRLSRQDLQLLERSYYQELLAVERTNVELWNLYHRKPADWRNLWQTDAIRWTGDLLRLEPLPDVEMQYKGQWFSTNEWGMRDRDYEREKPEGTYRIAVLGSSPVMGSGVADGETFESIVEERLNREAEGLPYRGYELLNFAVDGYTLLQQVWVVEKRAIAFDPDAILYVAHESEIAKTVNDLARAIERQVEGPYPFLQEVARKAGVTAGIRSAIARRRLGVYGTEVVAWGYRRIVEECRSRGVRPLWVFIPMPATAMRGPASAVDSSDPRVATLLRLATEAGFEVLDLSGVYRGQNLPDLWVAEWDRHPNARAHALIADRLHGLLKEWIEDPEGTGSGEIRAVASGCADC